MSPAGLGSWKYDRVSVVLHWTMALVLAVLLAVGCAMLQVTPGSPPRAVLFSLHKSFGLVALGLAVGRLAWLFLRRRPRLELPSWNRWLLVLTHPAFYGLMVALPLSGLMASEFGRFGVSFFSIPLPRFTGENLHNRFICVSAHRWSAWLLTSLIVIHLGAVVFHWLRGDNTVISRMLPVRVPAEAKAHRL